MYLYANGVVMIHGGPSGCTFTGTEGTLRIDRGHLTSDPAAIVKEPLGPRTSTSDEVARATTATGSTASARGSGRSPTSRSAPARWPSPSSATSPTGTAAGSSGTRRSGSSSATPRPTRGSTANAAIPGGFHPLDQNA